MIHLEVITRCTRQEHLKSVLVSILPGGKNIQVSWNILFDTSVIKKIDHDELDSMILLTKQFSNFSINVYEWEGTPGDFGHGLYNRCVDSINENSWVYAVDDDNEMHKDFYDKIIQAIENNPKCEAIAFSQYIGGKDFTKLEYRVATPYNMKVTQIDFAQVVIKKSLMKEKRLVPMMYVADGIFIENLFNDNPGKWVILPDVLCNYNSLIPISKPNKSYTLPRVLILDKYRDLKTTESQWESSELNVIESSDSTVAEDIAKYDPDCILSQGNSAAEFPNMCNQSIEYRTRWINPTDSKNLSDVSVGEMSYFCAMNHILVNDKSQIVSVITSAYNTGEKIRRTYRGLISQTYRDWEWVVVNDSTDDVTSTILEEIASKDPRVKVFDFKQKTGGIIGEAKYRACVLSSGDYIMELDHDDYLLPNAIELMIKSFNAYPDAGFSYSDGAELFEDLTSIPRYGEGFALGYGSYRVESHFGKDIDVVNTSNINPLTIRHIVGVPNHFRAWRRKAYFDAGCHNRRLSIADDYELLVRTFLTTKFVRIPVCCYFQFYHDGNSQNATRADIQRRVRTISHFYNEKIKARFEELGKEDWAYTAGLQTPPRKGDDEGYVNYIFTP